MVNAFNQMRNVAERLNDRVFKLETALTLIAMFKPQVGRDFGEQTNFATAVAIAKAALKDDG